MSEDLIPHLFRTEYRKIISVLCKRFGLGQVEIAEDIASDTFMSAMHSWGLEGTPEDPTAWLYHVAKNKARNHLQRDRLFAHKIAPGLKNGASGTQDDEIDWSLQNISDSQLQMMFAICHPAVSPEAQIGLSLRFLCGFGIEEIADAFLSNKDTINKRLFRAKEKLRAEQVKIELPDPAQMDGRLATVLTTIYLLFNEGYYSISRDGTLRKDLCLEAMRLCHMLVDNERTNTPPANALLSLMYFHVSRFEARFDRNGEIVLYEEQDTRLWDQELISRGAFFLNRSTNDSKLSKYHLAAGIAWWNTQRPDTPEKWESVLQLYNQLLQIEYSPMTALNRTYALSKSNSRQEAITEAEKLDMTENHFYHALLGELYTGIDPDKSLLHFRNALSLAKTQTDRQTIQKKIDHL